MRTKVLIFVCLFVFSPCAFRAQQSSSQNSRKLTDAQKHGQLVFQQHCSICHTLLVMNGTKTYGTRLHKEIVDGNEDFIAQVIRDGQSDLMPGFKYTLKSTEIDDIVEYLKTVQKPARTDAWY